MMARLNRRAGTWLLQPCLLLVWMLTLTGCNAATKHPIAHVTPTPLATLPPTPDTSPLAFNSAWGNVAIQHIADTIDANYGWSFTSAITPDGRRALVEIGPTHFANPQQLPSFIAIYDFATGNFTRIRQIPDHAGYILTSAADDRYFVWLQTADQNTFKWTMWLYDLQTQQVQQIGQNSTNAQGQPVSGTYPTPWVSDGHLVWGQRIGAVARPDVSNDVVKLMDLHTKQTQTIATSAGLPALAWPWLTLLQGDNKGGAVGAIKNLMTGQTLQWQDQDLPYLQSIAIRGHTIAYSMLAGNLTNVKYIDDFTQSTTPVTIIKGQSGDDYVDFVTLNDRVIGWGAAGTSVVQVWDRKLKRLVLLPPGSKIGTTVFPTLVYWPTYSVSDDQAKQLVQQGIQPPSTYNIIDTGSLP